MSYLRVGQLTDRLSEKLGDDMDCSTKTGAGRWLVIIFAKKAKRDD